MDNSGNRYSVLLVDDEEDVIRIIMKKLDWESMGLVIIGHAANGVEALEMAEELSPDIVMTDIKMPYMDGLTLCKKLKELSRTIRVIIFSGFDEFEYAKEAIKMEAAEYLLKPVNAVELKEVFERVKNDLDRELDEKRNTDKLRAYYMESLPVLQESFYMALLEGRMRRNRSDVIWIAIRCSCRDRIMWLLCCTSASSLWKKSPGWIRSCRQFQSESSQRNRWKTDGEAVLSFIWGTLL